MANLEQNLLYHQETRFLQALRGANKILDDLGLNHERNRNNNRPEGLVIFTNSSVDPRVVECFHLASLARGAPCNIIDIGTPNPQGRLSDQEKAGIFHFEEISVQNLAHVVVKLTPDESDQCSDLLYNSIYGHLGSAFQDKGISLSGTTSKVRCAESPGLTLDSLCSPGIFADTDIIRDRQDAAAKHLRETKLLHITGANGTDLTLEFNPQENVYYDPPEVDLRKQIPEGQEGRGANFPKGEVWRSPKPTSANGKIVLDNIDTSVPIYTRFENYTFFDSTQIQLPDTSSKIENTGIVDAEICLTINDGRIIRIDGGYAAQSLAWYLDQEYTKAKERGHPDPEGIYYFGTEIGIGANPLVSLYNSKENISIVESEKQLALHIAGGHSPTEYPYERPNTWEYNRGPLHLDFIVNPIYQVDITPYHGHQYTLFGPAGSFERYRQVLDTDIEAILSKIKISDLVNSLENKKSNQKRAIYKNIQLNVPSELRNFVDQDTKRVIELANEIQVIEYDSHKPGDIIFLTSGMHGEEAKGTMTIDDINKKLEKYVTSLDSGKIVIIPRLNIPGCKNFTRYVFEDEKDTNLNNEFHHFVTGQWNEFFALKRKTSKLAWIIMKYMKTKADDHEQKFGPAYNVYHIDLHREEGMPFIRIDRMDENKDIIESIVNSYWRVGLPIALETVGWRDIAELHQSISAVGAALGWQSNTLEEGNTIRPDKTHGTYIAYQLLLFLQDKGFISISPESEKELKYVKKALLGGKENPLKRARIFWEYQQETGKIYRIEVIEPMPRYYFPKRFPNKSYLENAQSFPNWDGIITFSFDGRIRGQKIEKNQTFVYGEFAFGEFNAHDYHPILPLSYGQLILSSNISEIWVADMTEPRNPDKNTLCRYGYFYDDGNKKSITLWQIDSISQGRQFRREDIIPPDELLQRQKEEIPINERILDETFSAIPDSKWEGRLADGKVVLFPKQGEVKTT